MGRRRLLTKTAEAVALILLCFFIFGPITGLVL
jgi:hypothetical protein